MRLLVPVAKLLLPPGNGFSARILPCAHTKPRHVLPVGGRNVEQLQLSPLGSGVPVCAIPEITPKSFSTGQSTALLAPPRVPRSVLMPNGHAAAWMVWLSPSVDWPATSPNWLMLLPIALLPPSEASSTTWYCVAVALCAAAPPASAAAIASGMHQRFMATLLLRTGVPALRAAH